MLLTVRIFASKESGSGDRTWMLIVAVVLFIGAGAMTLASSYNPVSTKNEGIETTFGATSGHLHNGFHMTWPWVKVHEMDAAIQTDSYVWDKNPTSSTCLSVRIANQQTGCLTISIRWRICTTDTAQTYTTIDGRTKKVVCHKDAVDELYRDYRTFDHVRDSLVSRELTAAVNNAFANYNPLDSISLNTPANGAKNPLLSTLAAKITSTMRQEIGTQIEVLNTIIPLVHYDDATQQKINQLQQQVAQTRIAEQAKITNEKQAAANKALAASVNTSPNVLVAQCLNTLEEMVKNGQPVPAGFSCWPGGSGTPVIANSGASK
jgi:regulator of protease activity HflC (stomatin/prohibitin superfamily)